MDDVARRRRRRRRLPLRAAQRRGPGARLGRRERTGSTCAPSASPAAPRCWRWRNRSGTRGARPERGAAGRHAARRGARRPPGQGLHHLTRSREGLGRSLRSRRRPGHRRIRARGSPDRRRLHAVACAAGGRLVSPLPQAGGAGWRGRAGSRSGRRRGRSGRCAALWPFLRPYRAMLWLALGGADAHRGAVAQPADRGAAGGRQLLRRVDGAGRRLLRSRRSGSRRCWRSAPRRASTWSPGSASGWSPTSAGRSTTGSSA